MTSQAAKPTTASTDAWGPYRGSVEDALASCADYLDRLQRSLAGRIAPDRHYFQDKSHELLLATRRLVRKGEDIERWLQECNKLDSTTDPAAECSLPRGYRGRHQSEVPPLMGERAARGARDLADRCEAVANQVAWITIDVDRLVAAGRPVDDVQEEWLRELSDELRGIADGAARLHAGIDGLTIDPRSLVRRTIADADVAAADLPSIDM